MSTTRPWVDAFADEMEAKLAENRDKGDRDGWAIEPARWLLSRLKEEVAELEVALDKPAGACGCRTVDECRHIGHFRDEEEILGECADVANFAMMIADVAGGLEPEPTSRPPAGDDDHLAAWFQLSYANYLTVPRSLLEAMPSEWRNRLGALLQELEDEFTWPRDTRTRIEVRLRGPAGLYVSDPLAEYRHPDLGAIADARNPMGRCARLRFDVGAPVTPEDVPGRNS